MPEKMKALRSRMAVAVAALAAIAALGMVVSVSVVRAERVPDLPAVAPADLIASVLAADPRIAVAGRVESRVDVGLPELPTTVGGGVGGAAASVLGEQQYRVWRSSDGLRIAHLLPTSEQVLVASRAEAWWWSSDGMEAVRLGAPGSESIAAGAWRDPALAPIRIADVAAAVRLALGRLAPWADVRSDATASVAGRAAYVLTLVPRSELTLIGAIELSIDAETRVPLRVDVLPKGADRPAITMGFTDVSFEPIDPATFDFAPPAGARVRDIATNDGGEGPVSGFDGWWDTGWPASEIDDASTRATIVADHARRVFGQGFDLRLALRLERPLPPDVTQLLPYQGPLGSAIAVDRPSGTWLLAGSVSLATLRSDADSLP